MREARKTLRAIADALTKRGVPTKTGESSRWSHSAVARILRRQAKRRSRTRVVRVAERIRIALECIGDLQHIVKVGNRVYELRLDIRR